MTMTIILIRLLVLVLLAAVAAASIAAVVKATNSQQQQQHVTVIGLGAMGSAVAQCLAQQESFTVHVWTRSGIVGLDNNHSSSSLFQVHPTATDAIKATNLTLIMIDDWNGVVSLLHNHHPDILERGGGRTGTRTTVLFSTYSPTDIQDLVQSLNHSTNNNRASSIPYLVGGAIVGVPQTICSQQSLILTSTSRSSNTLVTTALEPLGRTVHLSSARTSNIVDDNNNNNNNNDDEEEEDPGIAALMNLALVVTIFFGLAGHELPHLMLSQYGVTDEFIDLYAILSVDFAAKYTQMLLPVTSRAMRSNDFSADMYAPTSAVVRLLRLVLQLKHKLGITDQTFLDTHIQSLERVSDPSKVGPAAWTKLALMVAPGEGAFMWTTHADEMMDGAEL